jgi:hypothetical protein
MAGKWFSCIIAAGCLLMTTLYAHAAGSLPQSIPVEEWLKGPERHDIAWKVQVFQNLTLQQRHLVQVLATIGGRNYLEGVSARDLHFVTKIADDHGNWLDGQSYDHFKQPANFSAADSVHSFANLYLKPGDYTVAVIAYDSLHNTGNIWRTQLTVPAVVDVLPDLGRDLPVAEFLPPAKAALELRNADWEQYPAAVLQNLMLDPLTLGNGVAYLPVANKKAVRIDVIVNLSDEMAVIRQEYGCRFYATRFEWHRCDHPELSEEDSRRYKLIEGEALEVGNVVSQLAPQAGCVRFSAVDALRQDLVADRVDASHIDWDNLSKRMVSTEIKEIDLSPEHSSDHLMWLKQFIDKVNKDSYECGLPAGATNHVLIVVSMGSPFPMFTRMSTVRLYSPRPACFHLRLGGPDPGAPPYGDQTRQILSPLKPKDLSFLNPEQLRNRLALIVEDLAAAN